MLLQLVVSELQPQISKAPSKLKDLELRLDLEHLQQLQVLLPSLTPSQSLLLTSEPLNTQFT